VAQPDVQRQPRKEGQQYDIYGYCRPGFEPVRELFESNFSKDRELGAQLCAYYKGEKVVDL
jgi:hypothetical protein